MPASGRQAGVTPAGGCLLRCPSGCVIEIESVIHDADVWTQRDEKMASQVLFGGVLTGTGASTAPKLIDAMNHEAVILTQQDARIAFSAPIWGASLTGEVHQVRQI